MTVHLDRAGAPVQLSEIGWLKPPSGAKAIVYVAVWPGVTVALAAPLARTEKSWPVPLNVTVWGLPAALSAMVSVPARAPVVVGSKKTLMAQREPAARLLPQGLAKPKSDDGLVATLVMLSAAVPLLVRVIV